MAARKFFDFIYLLKFVAIILITNSHFKPIYNGDLKSLAFGGAFGCALFFFCSGFTMITNEEKSFLVYIKRRALRILPTYWIFLLLSGEWQFMKHWFCWGHYWFLQAILIFYCCFYFVKKYFKKEIGKIIVGLFVALIILYIIMPHNKWMVDYTLHQNRFTWIYYFAIMLLGAKLRSASPRLPVNGFWKKMVRSMLFKYMFIPTSFFVVYGLKFFCTKFPAAINLQLLFPILLMAVCYVSYAIYGNLKIQNRVGKLVKQVANITLEIYIVQFVCISVCSSFSLYIRLVSVVIMILVSALMLHWLSGKILCWSRYVK